MPNMERLWWVTKTDTVIGGTYRYLADVEREARHREFGVIIVRKSDRAVYFQKRAETKKVLPGWWSTGCAGHVEYGMTARDTGVKELREELNIEVGPEELHFYGKELTTRPNEEHWKYWYVMEVSDEFSPYVNQEEVAQGRFLMPREVEEMQRAGERFYEPFLEIVKRYNANDKTGLVLEEEPHE